MTGKYPNDLRYTADHEWIRSDASGLATIGITHYAQEALGDIVFVEMPEVGDVFAKGDVLGVVESVKTTSDVYLPVGGTVEKVNEALVGAPETLNADPHGEGWLVQIRLSEPSELEGLMDHAAYAQHVEAQDH